MNSRVTGLSLISLLAVALTAMADDLTQMIQQDLVALGYDPGEVNGEMTVETIVAISVSNQDLDILELVGSNIVPGSR